MSERFKNPVIKYTTNDLKTLPGSKLYFYETGTTTPKLTYQDVGLTIPHANPVVSNGAGIFAPIFLSGVYRVELKNSAGVTQTGWPVDNVGNESTGFVQGPNSSTVGALAVFDSTDGTSLANGPVPTNGGISLITAPMTGAAGYLRLNADESLSRLSQAQIKTDLNLPANTVSELALKATVADVALKAPLASPVFTGNPTVPTPAANNNSTSAANTAYVQTELLDRPQTIENVAATASYTPVVGQIYWLKEYHTGEEVGGGALRALAGSPTIDNGDTFASATVGVYFKRQKPEKTPYEFGYLDGDVDVQPYVDACSLAYGECYLDGGTTYDAQHQLNVVKLKARGEGNAVINLTSPTANTRWGGPSSSFGNTTAVMCYGDVGDRLVGADVQNITVNCNALIGATGSVGIKGFMFVRCENFYQRACTVIDSASYAFWDYDVATTGTDYCSGTRDDCYAFDCGVSFEQVNVRGVTLNNCHGYISSATLGYTPECIFHPYGGSDMQVVYNNCTGIADGTCPTVFAALLECKNVTANDCQFINRHDGGVSVQAAVYFEPAGGNYDRINFKNCILRADYWAAVVINVGASGSTSASFAYTDCVISGKSIGVGFSGTGGFYSFTNCIATGTSISGGTAYGYKNDASGASFQITGGSAIGTGGVSPQASDLKPSVFNGTRLVPATFGPKLIRQQNSGQTALANNGTYASQVINLTGAALDDSKVFVSMHFVSAFGDSDATAEARSRALSFRPLSASGSTNFRIYCDDVAAAGSVVSWVITEYE